MRKYCMEMLDVYNSLNYKLLRNCLNDYLLKVLVI